MPRLVKDPDGRATPAGTSHRETRRAELVEAAVAAIDEHGPSASIAEIAASAGVSKPVLYRYFADKDDLYRAVGALGCQRRSSQAIAARPARRTARCASGSSGAARRYLTADLAAPQRLLPAGRAPEQPGPARRRQGDGRGRDRAHPRRRPPRARRRRRRRRALGLRPRRARALHRRVVAAAQDDEPGRGLAPPELVRLERLRGHRPRERRPHRHAGPAAPGAEREGAHDRRHDARGSSTTDRRGSPTPRSRCACAATSSRSTDASTGGAGSRADARSTPTRLGRHGDPGDPARRGRPGRLSDVDPWGRFRISGTGRPPF